MKDTMILSDDISEVICATLRAAIFEGSLKPGDKLKEDVLATHFKASRTVVRGALTMLAQQKLAERRRNHGSFVATPSKEEAQNLLATRRVLEMAVMDTIPGRLKAKDFDVLARHVENETKVHSGHDSMEKKRIAGDFHHMLAEYAGNDVLLTMLENVLTRLSLVQSLYERKTECNCGTSHHAVILEHLKSEDYDAAREAMAVHLEDMADNIVYEGVDGEKDEFLAILERMTGKT
ncbi:GntR family transcriptional regulator [Salipiger pallidus]|uniref:GntR family transcriptional regulator n=1 Tax=Salipiger pallidus TaxID=1775170 RepID=A0A8J2ZJ71_9RHOB|nr:GntR family transcriptional regulator [Salipiger pallidus]GGG69380.1 GntR family transcriptional regulator [Salipiger pallidus]